MPRFAELLLEISDSISSTVDVSSAGRVTSYKSRAWLHLGQVPSHFRFSYRRENLLAVLWNSFRPASKLLTKTVLGEMLGSRVESNRIGSDGENPPNESRYR